VDRLKHLPIYLIKSSFIVPFIMVLVISVIATFFDLTGADNETIIVDVMSVADEYSGTDQGY